MIANFDATIRNLEGVIRVLNNRIRFAHGEIQEEIIDIVGLIEEASRVAGLERWDEFRPPDASSELTFDGNFILRNVERPVVSGDQLSLLNTFINILQNARNATYEVVGSLRERLRLAREELAIAEEALHSAELNQENIEAATQRLREAESTLFNWTMAMESIEYPMIHANVAIRDNFVVIRIVDNGSGISDEFMEIVGPNGRQRATYLNVATHGTGLGLAEAWYVIRDHGGTLQIRREPNEDTAIEIRIPLGPDRVTTEPPRDKIVIAVESGSAKTLAERTQIRERLHKASQKIREEVMVEFVDYDTDSDGLRKATSLAEERGAAIGIPLSGEVLNDLIANNQLANLLDWVSNDLFRFANPDIVKMDIDPLTNRPKINPATGEPVWIIDEEAVSLLNVSQSARIIKEALPPIVLMNLAGINLYNMRMRYIAKKTTKPEGLSAATEDYIENRIKDQHIMSVKANSPAEMKLIAEAHRERMRGRRRLDPSNPKSSPVRLQVRLRVDDAEKGLLTDRTKQELIRTMGLEDVLLPEDLILVYEDETASEIYKSIQAQYNTEHIAIVESFKENRVIEELPGEAVFVEYKGTATGRTYDLALELLAQKPIDPIPGVDMEVKGMRWYLIEETPDINTEEVANEVWWYNKTIKEAIKDF